MRLALIADTFPPLRNSGAVQLRDLSREFVKQGHDLTVMLPASDIDETWQLEETDGARVLRLRAPRIRDIGFARRAIAELVMPFAMWRGLKKSPLAHERWDGVVWYSPSIFLGPLVKSLKEASGCKGYLIIRDIFPEWAVDMELMGRGLAYHFFRSVARYQYSLADVIGVQTPGNLRYFDRWTRAPGRTLEVLPNWLGAPGRARSPIQVEHSTLAGRKILVYAGNMGVAQNMDAIVELAARMRNRSDLGFLLVGRGSEVRRLKGEVTSRGLDNVLFFDEIDPDEIPDLYRQCHSGIVSLDPRHKSHNIPGKFLTYMQCGLPVLANVNAGNDIAGLVRDWKVGAICENGDAEALARQFDEVLAQSQRNEMRTRCRRLFVELFSVERTVRSIVKHF